ncbi:MAG: phage holin family protein [Proteobacteria bacterium]|uniref:phage holin family protein n=1 Tax=Aquabacterium sp. TaxID=1872578 RepID=UPI0035C6E664|nr:phage holin family protein [Pseudomonadota bacterium]
MSDPAAGGAPASAGASGALGGLGASVRQLGGTLLEIAHTRLELLAVEVEEEKRRLLAVMAWGAFGVLMASVGLVFLAAFLSVLLWETHRLAVLGGLSLLFFGLCGLAVRQVGRMLRASEGMLKDTLAELDADRKALHDPARH